MNKCMSVSLFLISMCWVLSAVSGCVASYGGELSSVSVEDIEVKSLSEEYSTPVNGERGNILNVTACIVNADKSDSSALLVRFKLEKTVSSEPSSSREVAIKNVELDCMKGRSMLYQSVQIAVPGPGTYDVEVSVFEEGKDPSPTVGTTFVVGEEGEVEMF
ncbi:TPA: hypothetical protein HA338_02675 [Methanosarcina acetivorans]|uniref:CARDB domain-containing protein n=2 Tax=Methanosarcina acetivorans TaxID=2214 RepID=Q8TSD8_METAC|nr:hypothetical protein [Methanosarcina acetivorans]AAM04299.1 predicted protein [Methanosarcina acetivorans C2A]HIH92972.1 hypothetical protein [Methanosarcina acetivorans]